MKIYGRDLNTDKLEVSKDLEKKHFPYNKIHDY